MTTFRRDVGQEIKGEIEKNGKLTRETLGEGEQKMLNTVKN